MNIKELSFKGSLGLIRKCNQGDYGKLIEMADQCDLLILSMVAKKFYIPCSIGVMEQFYRVDQKRLNHTPKAQYHTKNAIGKGIITSDNENWKEERQKVQGMFGITQLENLYEKIRATIREEMNQSEGNSDALNFFTGVTLQTTGNLLFGNISKEDSAAIKDSTANMIKPVFRKVVNPLYWMVDPFGSKLKSSKKKLFATVNMCIERARRNEEENLVKKYFPSGYQTESILNVFTAGYETTSNAITWMFIELSKDLEAMKKIRDEVDLLDDNLDYKSLLERTPYIQACFNEAIRLYPPIWLNGRFSIAEIEIDGYRIPKGSDILLSPYLFHHLPKYWKNPEQFQPARFTHGMTINDAYIPFGQGARSCIGARLAVLKACLITSIFLREFDFKIHVEKVRPNFHFTLRPPDDLKIELRRRNG